MSAAHALEEILSTRATVIIGCRCGWVHTEPQGFDAAAARRRARSALVAHKTAALGQLATETVIRCADCGEPEPTGHMGCAYPRDHA